MVKCTAIVLFRSIACCNSGQYASYKMNREGGRSNQTVLINFDQQVVDDARKDNETDLFNLSEFCHKSNLVLSPRKGTAVFWYNHHLDNDNTWMGERDLYSIHGGCAIRRGVKWIANFWIPAPYKHSAHIPSVYLFKFEKEEKQRGILGVSFRHLSRAWQAKTSPNSAAFYRLGTAELTHKTSMARTAI